MVFGDAGLKTSDDTARFAMKSSTGSHDPPVLVVLKMPPPTLPANIVDGVIGLMAIERIRPPMLPGPSHVHPVREMPAIGKRDCRFASPPATGIGRTRAMALSKPSMGMLPFSS